MTWLYDVEIPSGQVNQILAQVSARSDHRASVMSVCLQTEGEERGEEEGEIQRNTKLPNFGCTQTNCLAREK